MDDEFTCQQTQLEASSQKDEFHESPSVRKQ